ncbi:MAG: hypothetical protein ACR2QG_04085 [Gammaproteobacteria bacterium]
MTAFRKYGTSLLTIASLVIAGGSQVSAQNVYKIINEDGNIEYTDRPPLGQDSRPVETVSGLDIDFTDPERMQAMSNETEQQQQEAQGNQQAGDEEAAQTKAELEQQAQEQNWKQQNCERARQLMTRYEQTPRLYRTSEDGEREYLDSEEIDSVRAQATLDVEKWCS